MHEKKCDKAAAVFDIICAILCIVSIFIILEGTKKYGPGVTHDSVAYMFAAASAANGKGLQYFAYTSPFIQWPPLFPLILAVSRPLGIDPLAFSRYFNAIVMSLALWTGSRTVSRLTEHGFMPVLFILMGMLSFPLISMSFYVWSEPLFILLSAVAFHIVLTSDFKGGYIKPVILAGLITALACLTRYAGLITAAMICLYLPFRIEKPLDKFNAAFLFGCVSIIPVTVFMIRNDTLTGTLMGMRIPSGIPPSVNFGRAAKTIAGWISPVVSEPGAVSGFFLFAVISSFILLTAILLWQIFINPSKRHVLLFFSSYCLFYSVYMAVSATRVSLDPVSDRYMIPVMLPLLTIIALILDGALKKTEISPKAASIAVLVILTAL
jgi:hypothetical protein